MIHESGRQNDKVSGSVFENDVGNCYIGGRQKIALLLASLLIITHKRILTSSSETGTLGFTDLVKQGLATVSPKNVGVC